MSDLLNNTITVKIGDDEFVFKVPSPKDYIQIGMHAAALRRAMDPQHIGNVQSIDAYTYELIQSVAVMQVCLQNSSAQWAYSEVEDGNGKASVQVNLDKFPPKAITVLAQINDQFEAEVSRFLSEGN
ncbi:MAG: hypothetical protein KGI54_14975 [Pseudomonadota bacterium]|nr:hypothetical protein [Pseudomonadota bacterium]